MRNQMNTYIRPSAMGGYVMSPFGDIDAGGIITGLINVGGKIVDAVGRGGATATQYTPPNVNPYQTNTQQGWGAAPPQVVGQDNTMLYVIGGAALLMVGGLILTSRR